VKNLILKLCEILHLGIFFFSSSLRFLKKKYNKKTTGMFASVFQICPNWSESDWRREQSERILLCTVYAAAVFQICPNWSESGWRREQSARILPSYRRIPNSHNSSSSTFRFGLVYLLSAHALCALLQTNQTPDPTWSFSTFRFGLVYLHNAHMRIVPQESTLTQLELIDFLVWFGIYLNARNCALLQKNQTPDPTGAHRLSGLVWYLFNAYTHEQPEYKIAELKKNSKLSPTGVHV
jgi:hypothetical protein